MGEFKFGYQKNSQEQRRHKENQAENAFLGNSYIDWTERRGKKDDPVNNFEGTVKTVEDVYEIITLWISK